MRRLAGMVVLIALASAGCIGSTSSSTSTGRSDDLGLTPLKTDMSIRYRVSTCPSSAHCFTTSHGFRVVSRRLTCSPNGGDYDNPAAACRALTHIVTKLDARGRAFCLCPLMVPPLPKAVGSYRDKRRIIPLDYCSLCGLPDIDADIALLMPHA